jgi:hypothetical protein
MEERRAVMRGARRCSRAESWSRGNPMTRSAQSPFWGFAPPVPARAGRLERLFALASTEGCADDFGRRCADGTHGSFLFGGRGGAGDWKGVVFEPSRTHGNRLTACGGVRETSHRRLHVERSARLMARCGPVRRGGSRVRQAERVLRVSRRGQMGTDMHMAPGWEAQESHGHAHRQRCEVQRTLEWSKASRSGG